MFPYIGIMADEEPKDSISPSGLYNTSGFSSAPSDGFLSDVSLSGLGEFTFMCWVYPVSPSSNITVYRESSSSLRPLYFLGSGSVSVSFDNSNGGVTTLQYPYTREVNEWHHWTVTGSVSNGRLRLYKDGILVQSAVMTYANETSSIPRIDNDSYHLSQLNIYDRELSESEVAEHYVYDDDLLFEGVLGYDAMTASQRDGLVYSSSYTDTISIAGNEFTDKSGNGVTLSPQPTLTGQQIYVYTDANDLPNGGGVPVVYSVNSADMNNGVTNTYYTKTPTSSTDITVGVYVKFRDVTPVDSETLYEEIGSDNANYNMSIRRMTTNKIRVFWANTGSGGQIIDSTSTVTSGVWYYILVRKTLTSTQIYINTSLDKDQVTTGSMALLPSTSATIGRHFPNGARRLNGSISFIEIFDSAISDTEINELHSYYDDISDEVTCYEDKSQWYKDNVFSFNRMSNYASNTGEETDDLSGNGRVLTTFGSIPYINAGLTVECGGTPTPPSNALPSNLPTIL